MADLTISFVASKVADGLSRLLIQESAVLGGVVRQVEWIERELRLMQAYLEHVERSSRQDFNKWEEDLKKVAQDAEDVIQTFVIKSVRRRRRRVLYLLDRYKVGKDLERISQEMRKISSRRKNHDYEQEQTNMGKAVTVTVETPGETSAAPPSTPKAIVAQAVEKLSNLLSQDLITRTKVIKIVEQARDELVDMQNIVSGLKFTSQRESVWLEEVKSVCDLAEHVAGDFITTRMGRREHVRFPFGGYASPEKKFKKQMKHVSTQIGDALHRWFTYGVREVDLDSGDKIRTRSRLVPSFPLGRLIIEIVPFFISYIIIFPFLTVLTVIPYFVLQLERKQKSTKKGKLTTLKAFLSSVLIDSVVFILIYVFGLEASMVLDLGSFIYAVIFWTVSLWRSMDRNMKSTRRDLALMCALFNDVESAQDMNKRQKVWVEQLRFLAQNAHSLIDAANRKDGFFTRLKFAKDINSLLYEIHTVSERKKIYGIANMEGRNGLDSSGPSTQVQESGNESNSSVVEHPDNSGTAHQPHAPADSSYRRVTGLKQKVQSIRGEMQLMDALSQDVQEMGELDGRSKVWVQEMKGIARETESVINDYASKLEHEPIHIHILNYGTRRFIRRKIDYIRKKIQDASIRRKTYGLVQFQARAESFSGVQRLRPRTQPSLIVRESSIVGFDDGAEVLMAQLLSDEERRCIISIIGIGGTGKTTLAKLMFDSNAVKDVFEHRAWVSVPPNCTAQLLLEDIAKQMMGGQEDRWTTEDMIQALKTFLGNKRCLIVVDGVETYRVLDTLKETILDVSTACKLLLTSRNANVELHAGTRTFVHQLQLLDDENSWLLFIRKLKVDIPPELMKIGKEIVIKCGGLPSEILKMSDLLSHKDVTNEEWSKVLEEFNQDRKPWLETLNTINLNLPLYLRRCLFYFVLFPAEFGIPARRLVVLWVAEGLVHHREDEEPPEQVAERYLTELIDLNMVQIAKRKRNGKVKTCRLPNALRELWLTKANESRFLQGHDAKDKDSVPIRRVADHLDKNETWHNHIHNTTQSSSALLRTNYKDVVSFLSFDTQEGGKPGQDIFNFLNQCIASSCFLLLRVLDLEHVYKPRLPENLNRLSRLRYLGLRWTYLESLPSSISSLLKLQTLDLKHTYINTLTTSIWKMELRHLFLSETFRSRFPPQPIANSLSDLQTLWGLFVDEETPVKGGLDNLVNIRKLGVACQSMSSQPEAMISQLDAVADWIMKLEYLQSLRVKSRDEEGRPWDLHLKSLENHTNLTYIYFLGKLSSSSILSQFPPSLIELTLSHSKLQDDPMKILKDLPNLRSLSLLAESYTEKSLVNESGSFPQLHVLKLWRLDQLEEWTIEQEALPCLRQLEIRSCESFKMLPDGLQHVSTLLELKLTDMPMEIKSRVNNTDNEDWHKISHIPNVSIDDSQSDTINILPRFGGRERSLQKASVSTSTILQNGKSEAETCAWKFPPMGWVCMNSDGSVIGNSKAACGGLVRDEAGSVLGGFSANLGVTSIEIAQLWGVLHGLNYVWKMGLKKVKVDIDSQCALSLIQPSSHESHPAPTVIQGIKDALKRDWTVEFCLIYPEANRAADILALMGHDQPLGILEFNSPPTCLADCIRDDQTGVMYPRKGA